MKKSAIANSSVSSTARASRRNFLRYTSAGIITTGLLLAGCDDDDVMTEPDPEAVNLGSGDVGVLNYAYALEQLEAAFYIMLMEGSYYKNANATEKRILTDLMQHEVAHREFFKAAINGASAGAAIPELTVDFSTIDFDSRDAVLATAKTFENLGVAAYNGAGKLIANPDFLLIAGKIVSVEARHAAVINNLVNPGSTDFAAMPFVDANGLDRAMMPAEVLQAAAPFIKNKINASNLPTE